MNSLSPTVIQARIDRAREINAKVSAEAVVADVARLFELDPVPGVEDEFVFPALATTARDRIFGGQVIAQAMIAAARTVEAGKTVHSLHAYFLRGGDERSAGRRVGKQWVRECRTRGWPYHEKTKQVPTKYSYMIYII